MPRPVLIILITGVIIAWVGAALDAPAWWWGAFLIWIAASTQMVRW